MLGCSGTGFDRGGAERSGSALGEENAVDTGAISNAKKSAKVLRVFNAVEREKEPSGSFAGGIGREKVLEGEEFLWADERDDALMSEGLRGEREMLARFLKDADTGFAALDDEAIETFVVTFAGDENVIEAAAAGLKSFRDRMQAVEDFHSFSLERETHRAPNGDAAPGEYGFNLQSQMERLNRCARRRLLRDSIRSADGAAMLGVDL